MSHLEHLISRYLDGELNSGELRELRRQLDESPEARALLREMTAVTRSAREIPSLDTPPAGLEARLFHRLHAEGLNQGLRPVARASAAASTRPVGSRALGRPAAAVLLLVLFSLTTSYWLTDRGAPAVTTVAQAPAPQVVTPAPEARPSLPQDRAQTTPLLSPDETPLWTRRSVVRSDVRTMNGRSVERGVQRRELNDRTTTPMQNTPTDDRSPKNASTPSAPTRNMPMENSPLQTPELEQNDNPIALADRNNGTSAQSTMPALLPDPFSTIPPIDRMPEPPTTGAGSILAASFRPTGVSYVDGQQSRAELSLRLDARVGRDHQVSLIIGRSPIRSEQSATALIASSPASVTDEYQGTGPDKSGARSINAEETSRIELENETWGGIAYSYTALESGPFQFAGGVKAGAGEKSLRVGLEGTARLSLSNVVSIEFVPTVTHVIPHSQSTSTMMLEDRSTGTLSFGESKHSTFTSVGAEVGIRIALR